MSSRLLHLAQLALTAWLAHCAWTSLCNGAPIVALAFVGGSFVALISWIHDDHHPDTRTKARTR